MSGGATGCRLGAQWANGTSPTGEASAARGRHWPGETNTHTGRQEADSPFGELFPVGGRVAGEQHERPDPGQFDVAEAEPAGLRNLGQRLVQGAGRFPSRPAVMYLRAKTATATTAKSC